MPQLKNPLKIQEKPLIGMVHLPDFNSFSSPDTSIDDAFHVSMADAFTLKKAGFDAILIENFHDVPFSKTSIPEEKLLLMSRIVGKIANSVPDISIGVNILRNACVQALLVAITNNASFIRCNVWEGAYVTDQGIIESASETVLRKKNQMNSSVVVLADIGVKHASPLGSFNLEDSARNAIERGKADAIILSGKETGKLISKEKLFNFVNTTNIKPIVGSGLNFENIEDIFSYISGAIIGSSLKIDPSNLRSPLDIKKASKIMKLWEELRNNEV
ncbi:MAG: BtpA/SgcQ family protein [Candidatus Hodarchaeales archaeon]|jgi:membrane complex biogenesis BtpA family protein